LRVYRNGYFTIQVIFFHLSVFGIFIPDNILLVPMVWSTHSGKYVHCRGLTPAGS